MLEGPLAHGQRQRFAANHRAWRWVNTIGLAAAVGLAYFLAARLGVGLLLKPEGVAVFWPAAGISSGVLIALGPCARWPVAAGVTAATVVIHQLIADPLWAGIALGLSNAAEALITAGLIEHYFGADFSIDRLRQVLGLLLAAIVGTAISGIGGAVTYRLFQGPSATMLTTWQHWFASDAIGIIIVAPLVIGLAAAIRQPPPRSELIEGTAALLALAVMTAIAISLPRELWETVVPVALALSNVVVDCRPLSTGLRRGSRVSGLHHDCCDGRLRPRSFWRRRSFICRPSASPSRYFVCGARRIRSCCAVCRAEGERDAPCPRKHNAGARTR